MNLFQRVALSRKIKPIYLQSQVKMMEAMQANQAAKNELDAVSYFKEVSQATQKAKQLALSATIITRAKEDISRYETLKLDLKDNLEYKKYRKLTNEMKRLYDAEISSVQMETQTEYYDKKVVSYMPTMVGNIPSILPVTRIEKQSKQVEKKVPDNAKIQNINESIAEAQKAIEAVPQKELFVEFAELEQRHESKIQALQDAIHLLTEANLNDLRNDLLQLKNSCTGKVAQMQELVKKVQVTAQTFAEYDKEHKEATDTLRSLKEYKFLNEHSNKQSFKIDNIFAFEPPHTKIDKALECLDLAEQAKQQLPRKQKLFESGKDDFSR